MKKLLRRYMLAFSNAVQKRFIGLLKTAAGAWASIRSGEAALRADRERTESGLFALLRAPVMLWRKVRAGVSSGLRALLAVLEAGRLRSSAKTGGAATGTLTIFQAARGRGQLGVRSQVSVLASEFFSGIKVIMHSFLGAATSVIGKVWTGSGSRTYGNAGSGADGRGRVRSAEMTAALGAGAGKNGAKGLLQNAIDSALTGKTKTRSVWHTRLMAGSLRGMRSHTGTADSSHGVLSVVQMRWVPPVQDGNVLYIYSVKQAAQSGEDLTIR